MNLITDTVEYNWLAIGVAVVAWALSLAAIYESSKQLAGGSSRRAMFTSLLLVGLIYCGLTAAESLSSHRVLRDALAVIDSKAEINHGAADSPIQRAKLAFRITGSFVNYTDETGVERRYVPEESDIRFREGQAELKGILKGGIARGPVNLAFLVGTPLLLLFLGLGVGFRQRFRIAGSSMQSRH